MLYYHPPEKQKRRPRACSASTGTQLLLSLMALFLQGIDRTHWVSDLIFHSPPNSLQFSFLYNSLNSHYQGHDLFLSFFFFDTTFYNLVGLEIQCSVLETAEEIAELRFFSTKKVLLTKHAKRSLKESDFRNHPCRYFLSDMFDHSKYLFLCFNMAHSLFLTFSY